jgi:translation initiation factor 2 beta subunit (eIF-2beta)/eIF-5
MVVTIPKEMGYDPHYRYKRPEIECESTGKSRRTKITNIDQLCASLEILPAHLHKLLQQALPATAVSKDFVIKGVMTAHDLDDILEERIIVPILLCKECDNPEVCLSQKGKARCKACGARCKARDYKPN